MSIKYIITLAVGFAAGYFVADRVLKEQYEARVQEEVQSIREVVRRNREKVKAEEEKKDEPTVLKPVKDPEMSNYKKMTTRYSNYDEAVEEESLTEEVQNRDRDRRAYQINDIQFSEENTHFDKITLYYYTVDDVLTEEDETVVEDRYRLLGCDDIVPEDDPSAAYFRNEGLMIDYEVVFIYGSYSTIVAGEDE